MNKLDCDGDSHFFLLFQTFRRIVFSAKWFFGKMAFRRSGFRQSVVHRPVEMENKDIFYQKSFSFDSLEEYSNGVGHAGEMHRLICVSAGHKTQKKR